MPEKSIVIDGKLITNPISERIEDEYIHIYPGMKMSVKIARSFADELADLGYRPVERTDDRTIPVDLPVNIMLVDDNFIISFYNARFSDKMPSRLHNFVIDPIPDDIEILLRNKVDVVSRVKYLGSTAVGSEENVQVVHAYFDLKALEKIGRKEEKLDDWFGD